jgi:TatA/E family protein of Tat protein translocase
MGRLGPLEIAVILGIAVLIFGPRQIPKLGRSLGETIKEFRGVGKELRKIHEDDFDDDKAG